MLKSFSSVSEALEIVDEVRDVLSSGGFNLSKFNSNSSKVLEHLKDSDCVISNENENISDQLSV